VKKKQKNKQEETMTHKKLSLKLLPTSVRDFMALTGGRALKKT